MLYVLLTLSASAYGQTSDISTHLKQTTECMFKVLKAAPGISEARLGKSTSAGLARPFLEYRAAEASRWKQPTRFTLEQSRDGHSYFMAMLPGIGPIDTHVTNVVVQKWKVYCGVEATVLME
jgi:hypothetical protein